MKLVTFNLVSGGQEIALNPEYVSSVAPGNDNQTYIHMNNGDTFKVEQSFKDVKRDFDPPYVNTGPR